MGSVGDCLDDAMVESSFTTVERELIDRTCLQTHAEARLATFQFIAGWYNPYSRHKGLGQNHP